MSLKVDLKILDSRLHACMPAYASPGSAGLDLRACIEHVMTLQPGETETLQQALAVGRIAHAAQRGGGERDGGKQIQQQ